MLAWFFAGTTLVFALVAAYFAVKFEKEIKTKSDALASPRLHAIVHELRSPVTAIKGAASLLLSQKIGVEEQNKMLHVVFEDLYRGNVLHPQYPSFLRYQGT